MSEQFERKCANCKFAPDGTCHRYPPQLVHEERRDGYDNKYQVVICQQPSVSNFDWCGEFERKTDT